MKKYMKEYVKEIDELIESKKKIDDKVIENHLIKIQFFMHERLVHLLVTILFALLTIITFLYFINNVSVGILLLLFLFIGLLIPYIFHYYYLENTVQYMYKQYDKMIKK